MVQGKKEEVMVSGERTGDRGRRTKIKVSNCAKLSGEVNTLWLWKQVSCSLASACISFHQRRKPHSLRTLLSWVHYWAGAFTLIRLINFQQPKREVLLSLVPRQEIKSHRKSHN